MHDSLAKRAVDAPRKKVAARMTLGEAAHKQLASDVFKPVMGAVIAAALRGAGIEPKEATYRMGYGENMAPLSNWIAGRENPQLSRLWAIGREFRTQLVIALAGACEADVEVKTVLTVSQRKTGT